MKATIEAIAAAWGAWKKRKGWKLGPGPAFTEAIEAALATYPAPREAMKQALAEMRNCEHDGGFDREFGPVGCMLGDKCVCAGIYPIIAKALEEPAATCDVDDATIETHKIDRMMQAIAENLPSPYEIDIVWKQTGGDAEFDLEEARKHEGWREVAQAALKAVDALSVPAQGAVKVSLIDAAKAMVDDYQTSESHHPHHVLVPLSAFNDLRAALHSPAHSGRRDRVPDLPSDDEIQKLAASVGAKFVPQEPAHSGEREALDEAMSILAASPKCPSCDGKGRYLDTTYDRCGEDVRCSRCDGLGVELNVSKFVASVKRAALGRQS